MLPVWRHGPPARAVLTFRSAEGHGVNNGGTSVSKTESRFKSSALPIERHRTLWDFGWRGSCGLKGEIATVFQS